MTTEMGNTVGKLSRMVGGYPWELENESVSRAVLLGNYSQRHQRKIGWMSAYGRVN